MKTTAFAALSLALLLAGCGAAPTVPGATRVIGNATGTRALERVELRVPPQVMGYVDTHLDAVRAEVAKERITDMYGRDAGARYEVRFNASQRDDLKVVVSKDGFKTTLQEITMYGGRGQQGRTLVVPYYTPAAEVSYYLEVRASVHHVGSGKLAKRLPVHYISNHGANFTAQLARAPH